MRKILFLLLAIVAVSCADETSNSRYASLPARYSCNSVFSIPPLYAAVNSPGVWCTVRINNNGSKYMFDSPNMSTAYWNITASSSDKAHAWVSGLIIGTPSYPEPGAVTSIVTCYDLVCPTCYRIPLDRQLDINAFGQAQCKSCQSLYDLNNQGFVISGPEGCADRLFRYRVTYLAATGTLLVSN